jgi:hypothetical protein
MIVVADASVLVAELLRRRGRELLSHPELGVVVAEDQWEEAEHRIKERFRALRDSRMGDDTSRRCERARCAAWADRQSVTLRPTPASGVTLVCACALFVLLDPVCEFLQSVRRADRSARRSTLRTAAWWMAVVGRFGMPRRVEVPALVDAVVVGVIAVLDEVVAALRLGTIDVVRRPQLFGQLSSNRDHLAEDHRALPAQFSSSPIPDLVETAA